MVTKTEKKRIHGLVRSFFGKFDLGLVRTQLMEQSLMYPDGSQKSEMNIGGGVKVIYDSNKTLGFEFYFNINYVGSSLDVAFQQRDVINEDLTNCFIFEDVPIIQENLIF